MNIISWNVNGIRAAYKKGFEGFLKKFDPDIICLQETKCQKEQLTEEQLFPLGYKGHWMSAERKGYSGVVTFQKEDPLKVQYGLDISKFDNEGRVVVTQHEDFSIYNIYFPNGAMGPDRHQYKMEFLKTLNSYLEPKIKRGEPIIVLGDYNVAAKDIDVYDPVKLAKTSGFLPEEKEWYQSFLNLGFIDSFRHFHPDEKHRYTWWSQIERARPVNRGWRIDMICITKNLEKYLEKAEIHDEVEGSDHCPISINLKF